MNHNYKSLERSMKIYKCKCKIRVFCNAKMFTFVTENRVENRKILELSKWNLMK